MGGAMVKCMRVAGGIKVQRVSIATPDAAAAGVRRQSAHLPSHCFFLIETTVLMIDGISWSILA